MAGVLGRPRNLQDPRGSRRRAVGLGGRRQTLRLGHVPLPQRERAARRAPGGVHRHRHRRPPRPHARQTRAAPDGLGRLRAARRTARRQNRRPPAGDDRREHRHVPPPAEDAGVQLRLVPRTLHNRPGVFPLDAVDLPGTLRHLVRRGAKQGPADRGAADPRGRRERGWGGRPPLSRLEAAGVSNARPGQLVPGAADGPGERGGDRREKRARRPPGRPAPAAPVDAADHRLRRAADRRPGAAGLVREHQGPAAELDRQIDGVRTGLPRRRRLRRVGGPPPRMRVPRGPRRRRAPRLHHPPGHAARGHLHGPRPRAPRRRPAHDARA